MSYLEDLPDSCPPQEATQAALSPAYRILPSSVPEIDHFYSHQKLGKTIPIGVDACRAASCSLFTCPTKARAIAALPKMRKIATHLASVSITEVTGVHIVNTTTKHVDLWPFSDLNLQTLVQTVEPL